MTVHPPLTPLESDEGWVPDFGINPLSGHAFFSDPIFTRQQNDLAAEIFARRPIPGPLPIGRRTAPHKWKVSSERGREKSGQGTWKIFVGTGCVNDEPAAILYQRQDDLRGWEMPENYGPFRKLARVFGEGYQFVDRPLYDSIERPHVLLTAPDDAEKDLGGFVEISDKQRSNPALEYFRTKKMWDRKLFRAHVVVSATPFRGDPQAVGLRIGGQLQKRWRVHAGKLPIKLDGAGVTAIDFHELARIYLTRVPGKPKFDRLFIEQRAFWSMQSRSSIPRSLIALADVVAESAQAFDLALLGIGLTGIATSAALLSIESILAEIFLANLESLAAGSSSVEFWSV